MILDEQNEFADAAAIGSGTGRRLVGDVIDLGANPRDIGNGEPLYLVVQVAQAFDSAGDTATLQLELVSDAQPTIATDGSATEHVVSGVIPQADLVAGKTYVFQVPMEGAVYERYVGVIGNVGTEQFTAGKLNAFLVRDVARWKAYQSPAQV